MTGLMTGLMTGEMTSEMAGLMTGMMTSEKTGAQPGKQQHRLLVKRMPILVGLHLACRPVAEIRCPACRPDLTDRCSGCRPGLPGVLQKRINTLPVVMAFAHFLSPSRMLRPPVGLRDGTVSWGTAWAFSFRNRPTLRPGGPSDWAQR